MNTRIQTLLAKFKETESTHRGAHVLIGSDEIEKFAELLLKDAFTIIKEAMVDSTQYNTIEDVIATRLNDAAGDVCDQYDLFGPIYEG